MENKENIEYDICENCEAHHPMDNMYYDDNGVAICPDCWDAIKDLIKVEKCSICGDSYEVGSDDLTLIDGKLYCDICGQNVEHN